MLVGCTGGQSGTETPAPRDDAGTPPIDDGGPIRITHVVVPCACSLASRNALLRVTLIEIDRCRVRGRVEEVLAVAPDLELELEIGGLLEAARDPGCGEPPDLGAGEQALLVYAPPTDEGFEGTALVATWGSEHVFGMQAEQAVVLPQAERARLLDAEACSAWFVEQTPASEEAMAEPPPSACGAE